LALLPLVSANATAAAVFTPAPEALGSHRGLAGLLG